MLFSIFQTMRNLQKQLKQMDSALSISFSRLKSDLSNQEKKLEDLKSRFTEQERINNQLKEEILKLKQSREPKVLGERPVKSTERSVSVRRTPNAGLTPLHLELLKRLMLLQMENGRRAVSMRELAAEVYPTKEYARIKSTVSEYVGKLHNAGLVEKMQKGRLYLSYTEKALQYADEQRLNRMKELISKPIGVR